MNFILGELRKRKNLTQQELGDILSVSYQTISKWETGVVSPDISMLPQISAYFGVSVDTLLGLVPLDTEYKPSDFGKASYWAGRMDYLKRTRKTLWNDDYINFLIQNVWKVSKPISVLDCGCGYGALGLMLLPILPKGSTYRGIDFSENLIQEALKLYKDSDYNVSFEVADIKEYQTNEKYDMVISQALLRHVDNGKEVLNKMTDFVKTGGILISMECNREFEVSSLYIDGMNYMDLCKHDGLNQLWKTELNKQNRDYSIAMKIPEYLTEAGFKDVDTRMNDRVTVLNPNTPRYEELLESIISSDHWYKCKTENERENDIAYFMNHGMSRAEAESYCRQQNDIIDYLREHRNQVSLVKTTGYMITYGWK